MVGAGPPLPMPRIVDVNDDDYGQFSAAEFDRLLQKMKEEREALRSDWQSLVKKNTRPVPQDSDLELQRHFQQILQLLQKRTQAPPPAPAKDQPPPPDPPKTTPEPQTPAAKEEKTAVVDMPPVKLLSAHNFSAQANALFRSGQFEDALATFRLIDLKGQKAEVRAPVQYLMALCLLHLGKNDEALPLLREVANSRGDDKLADYAQWQLEMLRWQTDIQNRLQDIRLRREALEKHL